MTEHEAREALLGILEGLRVQPGSVIFLGIDMGKLPLPHYPAEITSKALRERERRWCQFVLDTLCEVLGPDGTLIVPGYSYACSNPKNPFVLEQTPSEVGPFPEYVRTAPAARRSVHPIFSVVALGSKAGEVVENTGGSAFGPLSPFGRLRGLNARFVSLGVPLHNSVTYMHHMEQCYGCCHRYHKCLHTPVFVGGKRVERPFQAYLRYLGVDAAPDFSRAEACLLVDGAMVEVPWKRGVSHAVDIADLDRVGYAMLAEDPCAFLTRTVEVQMDASHVSTPIRDRRVVFRMVE